MENAEAFSCDYDDTKLWLIFSLARKKDLIIPMNKMNNEVAFVIQRFWVAYGKNKII